MRALALAAALAACALPACAAEGDAGATCREVRFDAAPFVVCEAPRNAAIHLVLDGHDGERLRTLERARAQVGGEARMAMNAGMYHRDRSPVGLYVQDGVEAAPLVLREGPGNFGLLPNGVFWSDGTRVHVTESRAFAGGEHAPDFATQSGPMLVIDGALHPRFLPDSESRKRRNGVGVGGDTVWFAISDAPVTFHHFGRLFRDGLGADNALFLDGTVSRIHAPEVDRAETGGDFGPMVVLSAPTRAAQEAAKPD